MSHFLVVFSLYLILRGSRAPNGQLELFFCVHVYVRVPNFLRSLAFLWHERGNSNGLSVLECGPVSFDVQEDHWQVEPIKGCKQSPHSPLSC
jgi:hypothetical protein